MTFNGEGALFISLSILKSPKVIVSKKGLIKKVPAHQRPWNDAKILKVTLETEGLKKKESKSECLSVVNPLWGLRIPQKKN